MHDSTPSALSEGARTTWREEEERIRSIYARRDAIGKRALYAWSNADVLINQYRFQATAAKCLVRAGWHDLSNLRAVDVGCGSGGWLRQLCGWGAQAQNLHGVDLLPDRISHARELAPMVDFRVGSGWQLPFDGASADLVSAHTVFSSILEPESRRRLADEMMRILAFEGCILIFDFRVGHPRNHDTIGIRRCEIARLFPGFQLHSRSLELAPPLARSIAPAAPLLSLLIEAVCPPLRTHSMHLLKRDR